MVFIQGIKRWHEAQQSTVPSPAPYRRLAERFAPLTGEELTTLTTYDYRPKTHHIPTKPSGKKFAHGWRSRIILTDNRWQRATEPFAFLKARIDAFSFRTLLTRAEVVVLESGGYIYPHSATPLHYQLSIPLIQDEGLKYGWADWGRGVLKNQCIYVMDVQRERAIYNEGARSVYLNLQMGSFSPGDALRLLH